MRLASFNVENLFARAKALNAAAGPQTAAALAAYGRFNATAAEATYSDADKKTMLEDLVTLGILNQTPDGLSPANDQFAGWALLRENRGDWVGWVELIVEPVDEVATRAAKESHITTYPAAGNGQRISRSSCPK